MRMGIKQLAKAALAGLLLGGTAACGVPDQMALGQYPDDAPLDDHMISSVLGSQNMVQVEFGRMALLRSLSGPVRDFAGRLIEQHKEANLRQGQMYEDTAVYPDNTKASEFISDSAMFSMAYLSSLLSDESFNDAFIQNEIDAHERFLAVVRNQAKPWASRPQMREELDRMEQLTVENLDRLRELQAAE